MLAGAVPTGVELTAGELLALAGEVLLAVADPVALADGDGDGLCEAEAPTTPPSKVPRSPGLPWTTADSGLPVACSSNVSGTAQPMNAATMNAAGHPAPVLAAPVMRGGGGLGDHGILVRCSGRPWARIASARAVATAADRRRPRSVHQEIVPDSRLPIVIPTSVPATPIRLPRSVANRGPAVAAAMAGRWERKDSGLAGTLAVSGRAESLAVSCLEESLAVSCLAESLVMISRAGHSTAALPEGITEPGYPRNSSAVARMPESPSWVRVPRSGTAPVRRHVTPEVRRSQAPR